MAFRNKTAGITRADLLVAAASVLLVLAALEVALRIVGPAIGARSDPISPFGPRYLPDSPFIRDEENRVRGRVNNVGFHDRTFVPDVPRGRRCIGFFGDSFVEAMQVEADSTFASLLEDEASAAGVPIEASAFGISGSGADQSLFRCRHALRIAHFDDVVYVFFVNDFFDGFLESQKPPTWPFLKRDASGSYFFSGAFQADSGARRIGSRLKRLVKDIYLPAFVSYRLYLARTRSAANGGRFLEATSDSLLALFFLGDAAPERHLAARAHWEEVVRYWKGLCAANGAAFRVLYMPPIWEADDSTFAATFAGRAPRHGLSEWMRGFCDREGIPFLDPTSTFGVAEEGGARRLYWGHLNYSGHQVLAKFLLRELRLDAARAEAGAG